MLTLQPPASGSGPISKICTTSRESSFTLPIGAFDTWTCQNVSQETNTQFRDTSYDWAKKKIAVIGNDSSAIQLLSELKLTVKEVITYIRSLTWITANSLEEYPDDGNETYSEEKRKEFRENQDLCSNQERD